ncbi:MAG: VOC family protein [Bryobacteraceae bacterium]|nr:VOC family protein [Bryobacteraceae bacterium]
MQLVTAWYSVPDMEKARKFYTETLGLKVIYQMDGWMEFAAEPGQPTVAISNSPALAGAGATIVWRVPDLEAARTELSAKGVPFEGKIEEFPGVVRVATFRDPAGNPNQLVQLLMEV